jgi:uncharacterized membrane protein YkoI
MKRKITIAAFTAAALIGGGSVAAFASNGAQQNETSASAPAGKSAKTSADAGDHDDEGAEGRAEGRGARTTAAEAAAAALKAAPGTVTSIDLDDGVWEVDVTKGGTSHEVRLDGDTNKVLSDKTESDDDKVPSSQLTAAEVAEKAAARGTVTAVEFDDEKSSATWEVETTDKGKETELTVDGRSGKITKASSDDREDDEDEADDADDEGQADHEDQDDDNESDEDDGADDD